MIPLPVISVDEMDPILKEGHRGSLAVSTRKRNPPKFLCFTTLIPNYTENILTNILFKGNALKVVADAKTNKSFIY